MIEGLLKGMGEEQLLKLAIGSGILNKFKNKLRELCIGISAEYEMPLSKVGIMMKVSPIWTLNWLDGKKKKRKMDFNSKEDADSAYQELMNMTKYTDFKQLAENNTYSVTLLDENKAAKKVDFNTKDEAAACYNKHLAITKYTNVQTPVEGDDVFFYVFVDGKSKSKHTMEELIREEMKGKEAEEKS